MKNSNCRNMSHTFVTTVTVFLLLFMGSINRSLAQSYYHFKVQHPSVPVVYQYFLKMDADGKTTLRIAYTTDSTNRFLAELVMTDSLTPANEFYLIPQSAPRFIDGGTDDSLWLPVISFTKHTDSSGVYYEPATLTLTQPNKEPLQAVLLSAEQKTYRDLANNKALVLEFYKTNDPFFIFLTQFSSRGLQPDEQKRKLYLIIVANTNDPTIGVSAKKDVSGISDFFSSLTLQTGMAYVPIIVSGDAFTIGNTRKVLDTVKPSSGDILFFYYTGHGFRYSDDASKYPRISFRTNTVQVRSQNNLAVEDIYKRLLAKQCRLTVVISDCCNDNMGSSVPFGMNLLRPRAPNLEGMKVNYDNFRKLFLPNQPTSVIIGSAAPNQLAVCNPELGGFFTNFLKGELISSLYSNTGESTWLRLAINAAEKTRKQSLTALCESTPNLQGRCIQKAELKVLPPF